MPTRDTVRRVGAGCVLREYRRRMETLNCPRCAEPMVEVVVGQARAQRCPADHGVFLERLDLGNLVEAEIDWHDGSGQHTRPLPRIPPDMVAPPTSRARARAWVETLFG